MCLAMRVANQLFAVRSSFIGTKAQTGSLEAISLSVSIMVSSRINGIGSPVCEDAGVVAKRLNDSKDGGRHAERACYRAFRNGVCRRICSVISWTKLERARNNS